MARHFIYPTPNPGGLAADGRIELHWQRELYVRLATTRWMGEPGKPDTAMDFLRGAGADALLPRAWEGRFIDLDRYKINHLIKELRIARDQAFGRDE